MAANNQIVLIGRTGAAPKRWEVGPENNKCTFNLVCTRRSKDPFGQPVTDWIPIELWGKPAANALEFVSKGDLISVSGALQVDHWEKDGQKQTRFYIRGENFQMLEGKKAKASREHGVAAAPAPAAHAGNSRAMTDEARRAKVEADFEASHREPLPPYHEQPGYTPPPLTPGLPPPPPANQPQQTTLFSAGPDDFPGSDYDDDELPF